jgi:hypothetical protein
LKAIFVPVGISLDLGAPVRVQEIAAVDHRGGEIAVAHARARARPPGSSDMWPW